MSTSTARQPRVKARSVKIVLGPSTVNPFWVVKLTEFFARGSQATHYTVQGMPSDFGRAFLVCKLGLDFARYHVNLNGQESSCECKGFLKHHHCKHLESLTALVSKGKLEPATAPVEATVAA